MSVVDVWWLLVLPWGMSLIKLHTADQGFDVQKLFVRSSVGGFVSVSL